MSKPPVVKLMKKIKSYFGDDELMESAGKEITRRITSPSPKMRGLKALIEEPKIGGGSGGAIWKYSYSEPNYSSGLRTSSYFTLSMKDLDKMLNNAYKDVEVEHLGECSIPGCTVNGKKHKDYGDGDQYICEKHYGVYKENKK